MKASASDMNNLLMTRAKIISQEATGAGQPMPRSSGIYGRKANPVDIPLSHYGILVPCWNIATCVHGIENDSFPS